MFYYFNVWIWLKFNIKVKLNRIKKDHNFEVFVVHYELNNTPKSEFRKFREFREIRGEIFRISQKSENAKD